MEQVSHIQSGFYLCPEDFSISQFCETFRDGASPPAEMQARHISHAPGWYPLDLLRDCDRLGRQLGKSRKIQSPCRQNPTTSSYENLGKRRLGGPLGSGPTWGMLSHFRGRLWAATGSRARAASAAPCRARSATAVTSWGHRRPCRRRGGAGRTAWSSRSG